MNRIVQWPDRTLPVTISCVPGVLTALEMLAMDGLLALPRIGLGVGGLLLGRREKDGISILRSVEIPCSHALGPSFILTPTEMRALVEVPESDEGPYHVVGWYCSKPRGALIPTEHDYTLFDAFCPETWQTLLLIRPSKGQPAQASFGFRLARTFTAGQWLDLAWQELAGFEAPAAPPPVVAPPVVAPSPPTVPPPPAAAPPVVAPPSPATAVLPVQESEESVVIPVAMPTTGTLFGSPAPSSEAPRPPRLKKTGRERPWKLNLVFAGILLVVLALIALLARGILGA